MSIAQERKLRAEIIQEAKRCEHWLGEARASEANGKPGYALCLYFVARQRSDKAFATAIALAAARASRLDRRGGGAR